MARKRAKAQVEVEELQPTEEPEVEPDDEDLDAMDDDDDYADDPTPKDDQPTGEEIDDELAGIKADAGVEFTSPRHRKAARQALYERKDALEKLKKKSEQLYVPTDPIDDAIWACNGAIGDLDDQMRIDFQPAPTPIEEAIAEASEEEGADEAADLDEEEAAPEHEQEPELVV